jgi:hypothetical protein
MKDIKRNKSSLEPYGDILEQYIYVGNFKQNILHTLGKWQYHISAVTF